MLRLKISIYSPPPLPFIKTPLLASCCSKSLLMIFYEHEDNSHLLNPFQGKYYNMRGKNVI